MTSYPATMQRYRRLVVALVVLPLGAAPLDDLPTWARTILVIAWFALFLWSFVPVRVELSIERGDLVARRKGRELRRVHRPHARFRPYAYSPTGRMGTVLEVRGEGGQLRIAAHAHTPRPPDRYEGDAVSFIHAWVDSPKLLDALLHELHGERPNDPHEAQARLPSTFEIPILVSSASALPVLRIAAVSFAPVLTMVAAAIVVVALHGPNADVPTWAVILALGSYVPAGALAYRYRASRPRFFLRVDGVRAELLDADRRTIGRTVNALEGLEQWRWTYRHRYGASSGPALAIRFGERAIDVGCLDGIGEAKPSGRAPRFGVGLADFVLLREAWGLAV